MEVIDDEVIKAFRRAEKQFFSAVKHMPNIDETQSNEDLKANISDYITKVGKLKEMLNAYEESVVLVSNLNNKNKNNSQKISQGESSKNANKKSINS